MSQETETNEGKYSRAVSEHAANSWIWIATKETKETAPMDESLGKEELK